jgi:hypothetical protein
MRLWQICLETWDIAGDSFTTYDVYSNQQLPWVQRLLVPYVTFFAVSLLLSVVNIGYKVRLLLGKLTMHVMPASAVVNVEKLGSVIVPPALAANPAVVALHARFENLSAEQFKFLTMLPLVVCEGVERVGAPQF